MSFTSLFPFLPLWAGPILATALVSALLVLISLVFIQKKHLWTHPERLRQGMGFASGFLLSLVLMELLPRAQVLQLQAVWSNPEASEVHATGESFFAPFAEIFHGNPLFSFVLLGILVILCIDFWVTPRLTFLERFFPGAHLEDEHHPETDGHHTHHDPSDHLHAACGHPVIGHSAACSTLGCLVVCAFFDGIVFSTALQTSPSLTGMILISQSVHVISETLLAVGVLVAAGAKPKIARRAAYLFGITLVLGAIFPSLTQGSLVFWMPFSAGILLYVSLTQLIPSSLAHPRGILPVLGGILSFGFLHGLIVLLLGHSH